MARNPVRDTQLRQRIAQAAARRLAEGEPDLLHARRRAALDLGVRDESAWPGRADILAALEEHRRIFGAPPGSDLGVRYDAALEAMTVFAAFDPRLAGDLVEGRRGAGTRVCLHLHTDDPEAVLLKLQELGIPADRRDVPVELPGEGSTRQPAWRFLAGDIPFEVLQLPGSALREPPRDPLDGAPMRRLSAAGVRALQASPADPAA